MHNCSMMSKRLSKKKVGHIIDLKGYRSSSALLFPSVWRDEGRHWRDRDTASIDNMKLSSTARHRDNFK